MSNQSTIEWTDATWNPVRGCVKVSPGCAHCYAETFAERFRGVKGHPYEQGFDLRLVPEKVQEPLSWQKPRRVFVNSMSDLFQVGVPDQFITDVFGVMLLAHWHTFQILTKRPDRMLDYMARGDHGIAVQMYAMMTGGGISTKPVFRALDIKRRDNIPLTWPPPNVWLGVSVENQHFADERIPLLLQTPAAVRFISAEPLLGPVDLTGLRGGTYDALSGRDFEAIGDIRDAGILSKTNDPPGLDWVIVGGESGPQSRDCAVDWVRAIQQQCRAANVPCFVKQLGRQPRISDGVYLNLRDTKGGDLAEWPIDLRVREFPAAC